MKNNIDNLAIIPARSGSKRIKNKNIKHFFGHPIIKYSISTALSSNLFKEVIVSTDSKKIKRISEKYGASVPFLRPKKLSGPLVPINRVLLNLINLKKKSQYKYFCLIYSTAPLINKNDIYRSLQKLKKNKRADAICAICKYEKPIQRALKINKKKFIEFDRPKYRLARSQDLKTLFYDCGSFAWYNLKNFLLKKGTKLNILPYILPANKCQDIDTKSDWKETERKFCRLYC